MRITKGLIVAYAWIGYILDGTDDWEKRASRAFRRGWVDLIRKCTGTVYDLARLIEQPIPVSEIQTVKRGWRRSVALSGSRVVAMPSAQELPL
ncbi:hypothetical protein DBT42_08915 [Aerococcus urinae]|nr:hypothetical protein DBT42_08915 [Aerococcus urinae]